MKPNTIIFVRHGETDWNKNGLIQGSVDTDLNETGHAQAKSVAALLAQQDLEWRDFNIVVSPQRRAQQTAEYILNALNRDMDGVDARVRELGARLEWSEFVETHIFNSNKVFAIYETR